MTDKEKLQYVMDTTSHNDIVSILGAFLYAYGHRMPIETINELRKITQEVLDEHIGDCRTLQRIASERAGYIKKYLEGKMWPTEELAKEYLQPQIDNAQAILDACGGNYHV